MTDSEYLKSIRKALHLTQSEMAEKLGYNSQQAISQIEVGDRNLSNPVRKFLEYIDANVLKISKGYENGDARVIPSNSQQKVIEV